MRRHLQYLKYVLRHKWYVFIAGCKLGIPLLALVHDWSKFKPSEWLPYARCFYAPDGTSQYDKTDAFNIAWLHHQKRNKHHWQYWMITWDKGHTECLPMPDRYRREMLADWIGAGRALGKPDTAGWYKANANNIKLHSDTNLWIGRQLFLQKYCEYCGGLFDMETLQYKDHDNLACPLCISISDERP